MTPPHPKPDAEPEQPAVPIAVLVVDDQLAVREGLARLISCAAIPLRRIDTAATGLEALQIAARMQPDVVVLDVDLAGEDGLALIARLPPRASVLVLTCRGDPATRARAELLGASAFIEKHKPAAELLGLILTIAKRRTRGEKAPLRQGPSSSVEGVASSAVQRPQAT